jgi:hypothetical protein
LKAKLIALNIVLVVALGAIVWQGRQQFRQARVKRQENIHAVSKPVVVSPPSPAAKPDAAQPAKYADVATKNLFSKDRNPDIIIDPPKVEPPKPMPSLPIVSAVLGLPSGTKALMAEKKGMDSRPVQSGDTIGEFKIVSLDTKSVVFDWDGKQISKKIDDLIDRSAPEINGQPATGGPAVAPAAVNRQAAPQTGPGKAQEGKADRPCVPGDTSPNGAVADGYKLSFKDSPFGRIGCHWSPVQ